MLSTLKLFPETKSNGFLTGVVLATAGYDGSKSDAAPQKSDSTDEHRLKVTVETCGVNLIGGGTEPVFSFPRSFLQT